MLLVISTSACQVMYTSRWINSNIQDLPKLNLHPIVGPYPPKINYYKFIVLFLCSSEFAEQMFEMTLFHFILHTLIVCIFRSNCNTV